MAFLLNKASLSQLRLQLGVTAAIDSFALSHRRIHIEPAPREKADCCYEIYVKATAREAAREQAKEGA